MAWTAAIAPRGNPIYATGRIDAALSRSTAGPGAPPPTASAPTTMTALMRIVSAERNPPPTEMQAATTAAPITTLGTWASSADTILTYSKNASNAATVARARVAIGGRNQTVPTTT